MIKILKCLGFLAAFTAVLAASAVAFAYLSTEHLIRKTSEVPLTAIAVPTDPASVAVGQRLATVRGCFNGCHGKGYGKHHYGNDEAKIELSA